MRRSTVCVWLLAAGLLLSSGCGGGGGDGGIGGGPATTADVGGTWLGPTGTATPAGTLTAPATSGGMTIDVAGNATGTGALAGLTGIITDQDPPSRILDFTGTGASTGINGLLMVSAGKNHFLFAASDGTFAAFQRNAAGLIPPYQDSDVRSDIWSGFSAQVDSSFDSTGAELTIVNVDGSGNFQVGTSGTNTTPLFVFDVNTGEVRGDYIDTDPPVETGNLVALLTPDRNFLAVLSCPTGAGALTDCGFVALAD